MPLYTAVHEHRFGTDTYVVESDDLPTEEEVIECCTIDFEPDREESIEIHSADSIVRVRRRPASGAPSSDVPAHDVKTHHTPGPWTYKYTSASAAKHEAAKEAKANGTCPTDGGGASGTIQGPRESRWGGKLVAFMPHHREVKDDLEGLANIRVMTASPKLLAACLKMDKCHGTSAWALEQLSVWEREALLAIREAIAAAITI